LNYLGLLVDLRKLQGLFCKIVAAAYIRLVSSGSDPLDLDPMVMVLLWWLGSAAARLNGSAHGSSHGRAAGGSTAGAGAGGSAVVQTMVSSGGWPEQLNPALWCSVLDGERPRG